MNQTNAGSSRSPLPDATEYDLIEDRLRASVRATIEAMFEEELAEFLGHLRYGRDENGPKGYRHGHRERQLTGTFGIRFRGDGEWLARKHGARRRREWRKVHLAMDTATGDIRAVEFTSSRQGDSPILPELLSQIPATEDIETVTVDGAYDTRRCHAAILKHGAEPIIPKRGTSWRELPVDLKARGLAVPPELAVGDGALVRGSLGRGAFTRSLWKAMDEVF